MIQTSVAHGLLCPMCFCADVMTKEIHIEEMMIIDIIETQEHYVFNQIHM